MRLFPGTIIPAAAMALALVSCKPSTNQPPPLTETERAKKIEALKLQTREDGKLESNINMNDTFTTNAYKRMLTGKGCTYSTSKEGDFFVMIEGCGQYVLRENKAK
ncbi:MAG: hypothetical protein QE263_00130 [Vampirovibrionales bacterium]|nr:hypothetical protein [Vampirovibrionales bacterium]